MRNNSAECFVGRAEGVFRAREVRRIEQQDRWDKGAINNVIKVSRRMVDGKSTVDRPVTPVDPLPPPPVPFEGARVQRERITRTDIEAFGTTAGCPGNVSKTTTEGAVHPDRRSEVLNEALAKEVERNVRSRNTAGELAAPQESKDVPIPPDSDPRKRHAMKASTAVASSGSSQMESSRAVADDSRMDVEGEERETNSEVRKNRTSDDE